MDCYSAATLPYLAARRMSIMTDRTQILDIIKAQIAPFNKKGVDLTETTTFQGDLE